MKPFKVRVIFYNPILQDFFRYMMLCIFNNSHYNITMFQVFKFISSAASMTFVKFTILQYLTVLH